jgi:hypothetical protein
MLKSHYAGCKSSPGTNITGELAAAMGPAPGHLGEKLFVKNVMNALNRSCEGINKHGN